tara:strand:+ start:3511 stop:3711 length:201 start_codon:yes stop_codon:yes gene_type:complete
MTIYEKAEAELHRQGLTNAQAYDNSLWIGAWLDDLECTIDIIVHESQVMDLADDYDELKKKTNDTI